MIRLIHGIGYRPSLVVQSAIILEIVFLFYGPNNYLHKRGETSGTLCYNLLIISLMLLGMWNKRNKKPKGQSVMDNLETVETSDTQDTWQRQSRDSGNIGYTRHRTKTIQRQWQHRVHKTQDKDNLETVATSGTQDTGQRQTKQKNTTQITKMMSNTDPT